MLARHVGKRGQMTEEYKKVYTMDDQAVMAAYRNMLRVPPMLRGQQLSERDLTMFYDAMGMIIQALEEVKKPESE